MVVVIKSVLAAYSSTTNKIADYSYTAWGEHINENENSSFANNPLRYCGEYYDYESGMTYLRARYYDSNLKRFITEDPIKDGLNWYVYCSGNPICYKDSFGLAADELFDTVEETLYDLYYNYYGITDYTQHEFACCLYTIREKNEETGERITHFSYTLPVIYFPDVSFPIESIQDIPEEGVFEAYVHTHPAFYEWMAYSTDGFSDKDWDFVNNNSSLYLLTGMGNVLMLDSYMEYTKTRNRGETILENLNFKELRVLEKISYALRYVPKMKDHITNGCELGWHQEGALEMMEMYYDYTHIDELLKSVLGL